MRMVLLSLAASAAFLPSVALAQDGDEQQEEMQCVYDMLSSDEQQQVETMLAGTDAEVAEVTEEASETLDVASMVCGLVHEWSDTRREAGLEYALSRAMFNVESHSLPASVSSDQLDKIMESFPEDVRQSFTYESQEAMNDEAFELWAEEITARLAEEGIASSDWDAAVQYMTAYGDLSVAVAIWRGLFNNNID